jgi:hypothetical protein
MNFPKENGWNSAQDSPKVGQTPCRKAKAMGSPQAEVSPEDSPEDSPVHVCCLRATDMKIMLNGESYGETCGESWQVRTPHWKVPVYKGLRAFWGVLDALRIFDESRSDVSSSTKRHFKGREVTFQGSWSYVSRTMRIVLKGHENSPQGPWGVSSCRAMQTLTWRHERKSSDEERKIAE